MKKVAVLMGTYNGERFLREQLDSIFSQNSVDITLFVSDDVSSDKTIDILKEYQEKFKIVISVNKVNKNFTYNFLDLIFSMKGSNFDYFALSDQDDVWDENKIINAINKLEETNKHFYCSNLLVVDEKINYIKMMNTFKNNNEYPAHLIFENICTGCTVVFNKTFLDLVLTYKPKNIVNHDHWLLLVASFASDYIYDDNAYIYYRQHGNNQIGGLKDKTISNLYSGFVNKKDFRLQLARELLNGFKNKISPSNLQDLLRIIHYKKLSNKYVLCTSKHFTTYVNPLFKKIKIIFNRY